MSIYFNVTEQDLINLRKLAEQQNNQRALKNKNRILKQTHDVKLAENLSLKTKEVDEVNECPQNLGDIKRESNSEKDPPQLAIENTPTNQQTENNENAIYDVELRKILNNMKNNTGFSKHTMMLNLVGCGIVILLKHYSGGK